MSACEDPLSYEESITGGYFDLSSGCLLRTLLLIFGLTGISFERMSVASKSKALGERVCS